MPTKRTSTWNSLRVLGAPRRCAVLLRGGMRCAWCEEELTQDSAQIDHVVPRSVIEDHRPTNLVGACASCNQARRWKKLRPTPETLARVAALLARPLDLAAGKALAVVWYPWEPGRAERNKVAQRTRDAAKRARWRAAREDPDRLAFPFGALAPENG